MIINSLFINICQITPDEIIDRIPESYSNFVIPFVIGITFIIVYLIVGFIRILYHLTSQERKKFFKSLITPKCIVKNIKDIFYDCLIHTKIWKRKPILGYMHSAIAFGWFLLIVLGHIEVALFVPKHLSFSEGSLFYPIFYRFFVWVNPEHVTLRGNLFFFLMDFVLLYVLSGIALAMFKRIRSMALGMRHTTKPSLADRVALYSLWSIFPLRLLAEGFTADLSGGSFLTYPMNWLFKAFFGNSLNFMPTWWAYSIVLGLFFLAMPFSRYMHIVTEPLLILFRNAGLKVTKPRYGFAEAEIYSCSSCGLCIDACPMNVQKKNLKYSSVYFIRFLRRHNRQKINTIAEKCLQCGKCYSLCPVGINSPAIRVAQRQTIYNHTINNYDKINYNNNSNIERGITLFFAGCMSELTPAITRSMEDIFKKANEKYVFIDKEEVICCGRPLALAGKTESAKELIRKNTELIRKHNPKRLVLSCPICYKVFKEEYQLKDIEIVHYSEYIESLITNGVISPKKDETKYVYHDPCELGRGRGIYQSPRYIIESVGNLCKSPKEGDESMCCGGSLGSITLDSKDRDKITEATIDNLLSTQAQQIVTACPLCYKTLKSKSKVPVVDLAQIVSRNIN